MKSFTKIGSLLFGLVAILHLLRVIFNLEVIIDKTFVPMWISVIGFIIPGVLSVGLWKEANTISKSKNL